jgi:hypothetical protein
MSAPEITDKLNAFLSSHKPLRDECHAVYLMVEVRKLIDHFDFDAPLIRYYADWTVHTEKEFGTAHITAVSAPIYDAVVDGIHNPSRQSATNSVLSSFCGMAMLRAQFRQFLTRFRIDHSLVANDELWAAFVRLLTAVIADQPIINPCGKTHNLAELRFLPSGGVKFIFKQPVGVHSAFYFVPHP